MPSHGNCPFHDLFTIKDVEVAKSQHPDAVLLVHPESPVVVQEKADMIGSTAQMRRYVENNPIPNGAILGTEMGLIHFMQDRLSEKKIWGLSGRSLCEGMKAITLDNILAALKSIGTDKMESYEVRVPAEIAKKAKVSINRMIEYS